MNRNEELLQAILNGESLTDFTPLSRSETYLKACINKSGVDNLPTPLSRMDALLFELAGVLSQGGVSVTNKLLNIINTNGSPVSLTAQDLAGVTAIRVHGFYDCDNLKSIELPNGVTSIGDYAFAYCSNLESVTLPSSLTSIGEYVFSYCSILTSITIPAAVTKIGQNALRLGESDNKATITMLSPTPPTIDTSTFSTARLNQIIVPAGSGAAYKSAANWSALAEYIVEATA